MHVANALKQTASAYGDVITWAGYNSLLANDVSVKHPVVIGVYPLFPDKAASAEVLTSGRAQSTLNEHHIKRTRYAHQVSLVLLYMLKQNAYVEYCNNVMGPRKLYSMWNERSQTVPQIQVLVYDNRAGVAHDSLCAVPARRTSHYMYNHATNSAAVSTH